MTVIGQDHARAARGAAGGVRGVAYCTAVSVSEMVIVRGG